MFEKKEALPPETTAKVAESNDIVIRTMPKEFYGKEASLLDTALPKLDVKPVPPPVAPLPPVPAPVPTVSAPSAQPVVIRQRSWGVVAAMALVFLLVLGAGGYGAYRLVLASQEQQRLAEEEQAKLEVELEAERKAKEEADKKAAEAAAAAAAQISQGKDTDSDGLTDVEEYLYGTNFRDPDSDEDSFLDGNEVFHRYHPLGEAPATLLDTGAVKVFTDATYPYSVYYPSTWSTTLSDANGVTFKSSRQATISVAWQEKDEATSLGAWLKEKHPDVVSDVKEILTKEGYYGYTSSDDRTAYLNLGTAVATLTYDLGDSTKIEYLQTFQMMVNSFTLVATP